MEGYVVQMVAEVLAELVLQDYSVRKQELVLLEHKSMELFMTQPLEELSRAPIAHYQITHQTHIMPQQMLVEHIITPMSTLTSMF